MALRGQHLDKRELVASVTFHGILRASSGELKGVGGAI